MATDLIQNGPMRCSLEVAALLMVVFGLPLSAEIHELPFELELPATALTLELWNADVEIVRDPEALAMLRGRLALPREGEASRLTVETEAGRFVVRRGGSGDASGPRIQVEVVLGVSQPVRLVGDELDVVATGSHEVDEGIPRAELKRRKVEAGWVFDVQDSNVRLRDVAEAEIASTTSFVRTEGTRKNLAVTLVGGTVEMLDHRGPVTFNGRDAELDLTATVGSVEASLVGGSLVARGGNGRFIGMAEGGAIQLDGWQGSAVLGGQDATFEVLASRGALEVKGQNLDVFLRTWQGALTVALAAGQFEGVDVESNPKIETQGQSEFVLDNLRGNMTLGQRFGSTRLTGIAGWLKADVTDGFLDVTGVRQLDVVGRRAEISAREVTRLRRFEIEDSRLDLDLTTLGHNPTLILHGASDGRVELKTPCYFKLTDAQLLTDQVDVTGCILHGELQRRNRFDRRGLEGNRRVILTATLGDDSTLQVAGSP